MNILNNFCIQCITKNGEFINILRGNDIKCNYDQELTIKKESVVPCVINNVLDAFLPSVFLTQHIESALKEGILSLNAVPYEER